MKKIITFLVTLILIISLSACGKSINSPTQTTTDEPSTTITTPLEDNPTTTTK